MRRDDIYLSSTHLTMRFAKDILKIVHFVMMIVVNFASKLLFVFEDSHNNMSFKLISKATNRKIFVDKKIVFLMLFLIFKYFEILFIEVVVVKSTRKFSNIAFFVAKMINLIKMSFVFWIIVTNVVSWASSKIFANYKSVSKSTLDSYSTKCFNKNSITYLVKLLFLCREVHIKHVHVFVQQTYQHNVIHVQNLKSANKRVFSCLF